MSKLDLSALHQAHETLLSQYKEHMNTALTLQHVLKEDILPEVLDGLGPKYGPEDIDAARRTALEWLDDEASIFRMLRRHRFTRSFALEYLRDTLSWRLRQHHLMPRPNDTLDDLCCILPHPAQDRDGRLLMIMQASKVARLSSSESSQRSFLQLAETLRQNLFFTNLMPQRCHDPEEETVETQPVLQYAVILDVAETSVHSFNLSLLRWFTSEIYPRFPGLVGPIFIVNYSWTQSSLWSVVKRILPPSILKKVFFVTQDQLHEAVPLQSLPSEYGGTFDHSPVIAADEDTKLAQPAETPPMNAVPRARSLLPHSLLNPFFGYPVSSAPGFARHPSVPGLRHGRRRKRDLMRTLLILWWQRWGSMMSGVGAASVIIGLACLYLKLKRRRMSV